MCFEIVSKRRNGFFAFLIKLSKNRQLLKAIVSVPAAIFLFGNILHAMAFFPSLDVISKCNGNTYYITWMHPFGDYQWTFYNLTVWRSFLKYDSSFFGYLPGAGPYKVICDEKRNEANIIRTANDVLVYTNGENPRSYDQYAGIEFNGYQYFLAWQCNHWSPSTCDSETYTLYQCNLDFKSCDSLPLQYTTEKSDEFFVFEADETANEINLYDDFDDNLDRALIFTWGEHPRCHVEGCKILEK